MFFGVDYVMACKDKNSIKGLGNKNYFIKQKVFYFTQKTTWIFNNLNEQILKPTYLLSSYPSSNIFSVDNADTDSCGVDPRYSFCYPDTGMSNFALQNVWKSSCSLNMLKTKDKLKRIRNIKYAWPFVYIIMIWNSSSFLYSFILLLSNFMSK